MMKPLALVTTTLVSFVVLQCSSAAAATTIDRDFRIAAGTVATRMISGQTVVTASGGMRDYTPGRPDLPWLSERVELPDGARIAKVEVLSIDTAPLGDHVAMAPSVVARPGLGVEERSTPDPRYYMRSGFQPEAPVVVGYQGAERGTNVASLQLAPARWDAASGRLERVSHVRVRLTLENDGVQPLKPLRTGTEWSAPGVTSKAIAAGVVPARKPGAEPFRPTQVPSLLGSPVQYVIITNDDMAATFQQLADWKTQCGVPAVVRTTSFIRQQYPFGADDAERIRLFIRDAYQRWGTQLVLLGGDTDVIPTRLASTTFYGGESIASDLYFSCLDGNWNADGDSLFGEGYQSSLYPGDAADLYPEVYVGRAPTTTQAQAQTFVNKTLQYEKTPVGDYENSLIMFGEVLFPQDWSPGTSTSLDGAELIEEILPMIDANPALHYGRLYENYTDSRWVPGALQETRASVIDSLNVGYNVAVHVGHGYRNVMSVGDATINNADASGLHNGNRLTNLYAIDCTSNAIDFPSIGEAFLQNPNGGAVTNIGSTRFDFPTAGRAYQHEYFNLVFAESTTQIGKAQAMQKLPYIAFSTYDGVNRWTQMTLLLLGDPDLRIFTRRPRTLAVIAPASLTVSDTAFSVNVKIGGSPLANALVTAYRPNDELASVVTDGAGNAVIPFRPDSLGSLTLTVTAFDCRPFQVAIPIGASGLPDMAAQATVIEDDNVGGTIGNGNGLFDAGETVDLHVPVRNTGGSSAPSVAGSLTTTDGQVAVLAPSLGYGSIGAGALSNPSGAFRVSVPYTMTDQREIPFTLTLLDGNGRHYVEKFQVTVRAPDLASYSHGVTDNGNVNGRPDPGETVSYSVRLRNLGTGVAQGVYGRLRQNDGLSVITDSTATFGDLATGQEVQGDALTFVPASTNAVLKLYVYDVYGQVIVQNLDMGYPATPTTIQSFGAATSIKLTWAHNSESDLLGYNVYRGASAPGPYTKINPNPTDKTSYYLDSGLSPLTRFYYKIAAVDLSGNESSLSAVESTTTNPPYHTIFPIPMGRNTPAPVAVEHMYSNYPLALAAGSDLLYVWNPDGTAPVDADGAGSTSGDFTTLGSYYAAGPSIGDLDGGTKEVVGATWDSQQLFAFDAAGGLKPGFPIALADPVWSGAALGDVDGDGQKEIVFGSRGNNFYAFHANGTELLDGDNTPVTNGVFKVLGQPYNDGTPALADLDGDNKLDIVYASFDGNLYAWRWNGTNVPGFPVNLHASISSSVAIGYLDGPGDTQLDIVVVPANDSLYVIRADGSRKPGFPVYTRTGGTSKTPSPALADMNNDSNLDVVFCTTNGYVYVWNHLGQLQPPWNGIRYSTLNGGASESSPVVADINGDLLPDIVMGDETGNLTAISGTGAVLAGFPIQLDGEVRGTPAVCDCDGDGKTEIVVAGWDKNLYVWDYDFPFNPGGPPAWPQFHHDAMRTGLYTTPQFVGVDPAPTAGRVPGTIEFASPQPNPARKTARIAWAVPADREGSTFDLGIYDLGGRLVQRLDHGVAHAGRFSQSWNLRGTDGAPVLSGVYFARLTLGATAQSRKLVVLQ